MKDRSKKVMLRCCNQCVAYVCVCVCVQVRLPVRWMAPESMTELKFSSQSDVLVSPEHVLWSVQ